MVDRLALLRKGDDGDGVEEYLAYAKLRGVRQAALLLELRYPDGGSQALAYGWLSRARFDPSAGILLHFGGVAVTIRGRNLRPLYDALIAHRATWVQELPAPPPEAARDPEETLVTAIGIDPP